jgi:maltose/moltooligosaccharide transporter
MLPWLLYHLFPPGGEGPTAGTTIPFAVRLAFYVGAVVFLAAVLWTVITTREHPPEDLEAFRRMKTETAGFGAGVAEVFRDLLAMPLTMRRLAWVQIFTWLGFFCMWLYFGVAVARNIFGGSPGTPAYEEGIAWAGNCFAAYSAACFAFSFALPALAASARAPPYPRPVLADGRPRSLLRGRHQQQIPAAPVHGRRRRGLGQHARHAYAIVAGALPAGKTGVYMGIFNFFIVIPEMLAALGFGTILERCSPTRAAWWCSWAGTTGSPSSSSAASRWRWRRRSAPSSSSRKPTPSSRPGAPTGRLCGRLSGWGAADRSTAC